VEQDDFFSVIEQRLAALESRLEALADRDVTREVKRALEIARVDQPFALAKARYVLELIVRDIYRRELPEAKPKPLFNMIEALVERQGLFSRKIATDINYLRINGNLIVHAQDEPVEITERQVEVIVLVTINLVEWYLTGYLPQRREARGEAAALLPPPPNPYRGLLAFREEDADNYFGREQDVTDLLPAVEHQPLVVVVGPSGSGKSSLVYAGVAARLRATEDWRIASFRPRGRPEAELAQALVGLWQNDPVERLAQAASLVQHWESGSIALTDTIVETLRQTGGQRLLLIADQFEELYTLGQTPTATDAFIDLLVRAIEAAAVPPESGLRPSLCLLPTLRADFLGHALGHRALAAVIDRYPKKLLGPVQDSPRLRAIIEQPAQRAGVVLEDLLTERILRDLAQISGDDPEGRGTSLPLLEFTLTELWGQQQERRLTHLAYESLGGIQQALARHADAVYEGFDANERERVRHVLVQMVRPGEGTEDTRQVTTRDQVRPENWALVTCLADKRLVVTSHDEATNQDTAEIIHEALIRHWQPLREWLDADRDNLRLLARLDAAAKHWESQGEAAGLLWRRPDLDLLRRYAERRGADLSPLQGRFYRVALRQARRDRLLRDGAVAALLLLTLTSLGAAWWAVMARQEAEQQRHEAYEQTTRTQNALKSAFYGLAIAFFSQQQKRDPALSGIDFLDIWESKTRFNDISKDIDNNTAMLPGSIVEWLGIGILRFTQGQLDQSSRSFDTALRRAQQMLDVDPNDITGNVGAMLSWMMSGTAALVNGDQAAAASAFDNGLPVLEQLADEEQLEGDWSLLLGMNRLSAGVARMQQGDMPRALRAYRDGFNVSRQIATENSNNILGQQALGMANMSSLAIANILRDQGDVSGALEACKDAIESANELNKVLPDSVLTKSVMILTTFAYMMTAKIEASRGDIDSARQWIQKALDLLAESERGYKLRTNSLSEAVVYFREQLNKMKDDLQKQHTPNPLH
jgi:tetratricopeptide (TPR) repeat protein